MMNKTETKNSGVIMHTSARQASERLPGVLAVGATELEIFSQRTPTAAPKDARSYAARWTKGQSQAEATVDLVPASRTTSKLKITLHRPTGAQAFLWPRSTLRRLEALLAQGLAYEIETRSIEEASAFEIRRTTPELVRSRAS